MVRLHPPLLTDLDSWIAHQEPHRSRPEAIRQLLEEALARRNTRKSASKRKTQQASEMADRTADRLVDKSMPVEEQQRRKRALIKGPKEFREIRQDSQKEKAKS
jgi:metal-responsive CopG/Arc/MetJ family transcriptional regulator